MKKEQNRIRKTAEKKWNINTGFKFMILFRNRMETIINRTGESGSTNLHTFTET